MGLELISVHFPKAAGTTLASALRGHYGDDLALDYAHDPLHGHVVQQTGLRAGDDVRAVHGHFRGDAYVGAPRVTFLREPVDNLMSIYFFWRNFPPSSNPVHRRFLAEKPSILHFALYPGIQTLMSDRYFGRVDLSEFAFVGFHETRRRDLERFSDQFDIPVDLDAHLNRTDRSDSDYLALLADEASMAAVRYVLREDIAFYHEQVRRFG